MLWLVLATIAIGTWSYLLGQRRKLPRWARFIGPVAMLAMVLGGAYTLWALHHAFAAVADAAPAVRQHLLATQISHAMYGTLFSLAIDGIAAALLLYFSIRSPRR